MMKYRIVKHKSRLIKRYAPQWYDPRQKQWKYWGVWVDGHQRVMRFATMRRAKKVIDCQRQRNNKPLEYYFNTYPKVVWESSEYE